MRFKNYSDRYPGLLAWGIFISTIFFILPANANKVLIKTWDAAEFEKLEVFAAQAYRIELTTHLGQQIKLEARMEGEHSEQIIINSEIQNGVLRLRPGYQTFFHPPNDKLAVHKVISISLHISVPENYRVFISAAKAHLEANGLYENLIAHLGTGNCLLEQFIGNAELISDSGSIKVITSSNTMGEAHSRLGKVLNDLARKGFYRVKAESVKGDISLLKTPE